MSSLFNQLMSLTLGKGEKETLACNKLILESGFFLTNKVHSEIIPQDRNEQLNDALIVFQMVFGKGLAVRRLQEGLEFQNSLNGTNMKGLVDPTAIAALIRTQFEAFTIFHNIYNYPNDPELVSLLYSLWKLAGLKVRQNTVKDDMMEEHRIKAQQEAKLIEELEQEIYSNAYYLALDETQQSWLRDRMKKRDFELLFKDGKFIKPGWRELYLNAGVKENLLHQYALLSQYSHPSNVSVFQFAQMYEVGFEKEMATSFLSQSSIIMAFMISEYCHYLPIAMEKFKELPDLNQLVINSFNRSMRGSDYIVSSIMDKYAEEFQLEYEKIAERMGK